MRPTQLLVALLLCAAAGRARAGAASGQDLVGFCKGAGSGAAGGWAPLAEQDIPAEVSRPEAACLRHPLAAATPAVPGLAAGACSGWTRGGRGAAGHPPAAHASARCS